MDCDHGRRPSTPAAAPEDQSLESIASVETIVAIALRTSGEMRGNASLGALDEVFIGAEIPLGPVAIDGPGRARPQSHPAGF